MQIYRGDLLPELEITLTDDGAAVDLTSATAVRVIGVRNGEVLFSRTVVPAAPATGVVTMPWQTADTDTAGRIVVEVEVTWPGSKPQTFRPTGVVTVLPDLG